MIKQKDLKPLFTPPINTAVLLLTFNRLDTTKRVFEAIRQAKPPRLYIASDGAREFRFEEAEKVSAVRDYVTNNIDWDCKVKTLFHDKNLGCGRAPASAISWFFTNEKMGIILEDDCLPNQSFFWFCEELLEKYKDDMRVWHISGNNFQNGAKRGEADYYFSIFNHIWGWASWANRWENYDITLSNIPNHKFLKTIFNDKKSLTYWKDAFYLTKKNLKNNTLSWWDYQWTFTLWFYNGLAILPNVNLISNIGFGHDATHTIVINEMANLKSFDLTLNKHPESIVADTVADNFTSNLIFSKKSLVKRLINKIKQNLRLEK